LLLVQNEEKHKKEKSDENHFGISTNKLRPHPFRLSQIFWAKPKVFLFRVD